MPGSGFVIIRCLPPSICRDLDLLSYHADLRVQVNRDAALDGKNSPAKRWKRAAFFAGQLQYKNDMLKNEGIESDAEEKFLETQHWLELIDGCVFFQPGCSKRQPKLRYAAPRRKHRYGSNR